jgi:hypothetical protein
MFLTSQDSFRYGQMSPLAKPEELYLPFLSYNLAVYTLSPAGPVMDINSPSISAAHRHGHLQGTGGSTAIAGAPSCSLGGDVGRASLKGGRGGDQHFSIRIVEEGAPLSYDVCFGFCGMAGEADGEEGNRGSSNKIVEEGLIVAL